MQVSPYSISLKAKIQNLFKAKFIESIYYPKWVSNMVPINRTNRNLHTCTNFHDLNKAYPKDDFPLPNIDILVDNI